MWEYEILSSSEPPDVDLLNQVGRRGFHLACIIRDERRSQWLSYLKRESISVQLRRLEIITSIGAFRELELNPSVGLSEYLRDPFTRTDAYELLEEYASQGNKAAQNALVLWNIGHVVQQFYPDHFERYISSYPKTDVGLETSKTGVYIRWQGRGIYLPRESLPFVLALFSRDQVEVDELIRLGSDVIVASKYKDGVSLQKLGADPVIIAHSEMESFLAVLSIGVEFCVSQYTTFLKDITEYDRDDESWDYSDIHDSPGGVMRQRFWEENGRYPEEGEL